MVPGGILPYLKTLRDAALAGGDASDAHGLALAAVRQMASLLGAERCCMLLIDRERRFRVAGAIGLGEGFLAALDGMPAEPALGTCGPAAASGRTQVTHDIALDPLWAPHLSIAGQHGLRACWSVPLLAAGDRVVGTFATYHSEPYAPEPAEIELAETLASIVALGLAAVSRQEEIAESRDSTVRALSTALDQRDRYTGSHSEATQLLARAVGTRLGLDERRLDRLDQVALLHDIGKLGIPNEVLHSPAALTPEQRALVREHPVIGERILAPLPHLRDIADAVRHEHERWDGRGYPDGLSGEDIPLFSRIVFACDAYHAMTSDRPYRRAMPQDEAVAELRAHAGQQFDPTVVAALLDALGAGAHGEDTGDGHDAVHGSLLLAAEFDDARRAEKLRELAASVGAEDLMVFRRVSPGTFSHVGGSGRGESWAGNIEFRDEHEALVRAALAAADGQPYVVRFATGAGRVAGPYYARAAAVLALDDDELVVFGSPCAAAFDGTDRELLRQVAADAALLVAETSPAKHLADELELLEAVRSVATIAEEDVDASLRLLATTAARALACEFGAVVVEDGPRVAWASRGWTPGPDHLGDRLVAFASGHGELLCQDAAEAQRVLAALGDPTGATAVHVVPIGSGRAIGRLVLVHADPSPRGFTFHCRRIAHSMADAAEIVIRRAIAHESLMRRAQAADAAAI